MLGQGKVEKRKLRCFPRLRGQGRILQFGGQVTSFSIAEVLNVLQAGMLGIARDLRDYFALAFYLLLALVELQQAS